MSRIDELFTNQRNLDNYLSEYHKVAEDHKKPKKGWVRSIREALGMTSEQLGKRVEASPNRKGSAKKGISGNSVLVLENNEVKGSITLNALERAAEGLGCELVYALVPKTSLMMMFDEQIERKQNQVLEQTKTTMGLEDQGYDALLFKRYLFSKELAKKNALWD